MPSTCNPSTIRLQDFCSTSSVVVKEESPIWTVWWIRVDIDTQLSSISMFATDLNFFKLHIDYSGVSEQQNLYNPLVRRQSSGMSPRLSIIWPPETRTRLFQKTIVFLFSDLKSELLLPEIYKALKSF